MTRKLRVVPYLMVLLPLDIAVALALLTAALAHALRSLLFKKALPGFPEKSTKGTLSDAGGVPGSPFQSTIVMVNWDGKHLLEESLPALVAAVQYDGGNHEILVVDNGSTDGSAEFVRTNFPEVNILALDRNYGFTGGNNRGIREVHSNIVVLLNNDMIVDRGFLRPLLGGFSDPSVFAVTSQIFFSDPARRREETGKTRARFQRGFFYLWHDEIQPDEEKCETLPVFWAGGGSCAIDRRKYIEMGGLDSLYRPFYVEDTDLSYQAWKRGWKSLLAPQSQVVHKHRGTSQPKFGSRFVDNTIRKNQYLFIWKNVTDFSMVLQHLINLPFTHGRAMLHEGPAFEFRAFARAFRQLPEAVGKRLSNQSYSVLSDREILIRSQKA